MAAALAACTAGVGGYFYGASVGRSQEQAAQKRADDARDGEINKLQAQIDASTERAQAAEYARQGQVREIYDATRKVVEKPVYRNLCVDADGVGLLDSAADTANGEDLWGITGDTRPLTESAAD
ncbi:hypothetical protein WG907_05230 [Sphingobium sp. AN558]|uniref:hypothetical protein n=1 Tax=Sphingobium sp. AN558 TaxID=3133442 RepID=UPI0030BD4762